MARWRLCSKAPVHPHVCGDNYDYLRLVVFSDGSPPRVWGQREAYEPQP